MTVEHDTISAVVAELRDILKDAGESTNSDPAQNYLNVCLIDRLERIDAEMRRHDYKTAWEESDKAVTALMNVQRNLSNDLADLRAKLAACEASK